MSTTFNTSSKRIHARSEKNVTYDTFRLTINQQKAKL